MNTIEQAIDLLGQKVKDKVTGFHGVISSISFDLYGCIQAVISPSVDKDGKTVDSSWFDLNRIILIANAKRVMPVPNFKDAYIPDGKKGPAEKPAGR